MAETMKHNVGVCKRFTMAVIVLLLATPVFADSQPPTISGLVENGFVTGAEFQHLHGAALDDDSGVDRVQYLLRDLSDYGYVDLDGHSVPWGPVDLDLTQRTDGSSAFSIRLNYMPVGRYRWYVRAIDNAGNVAPWIHRDIIVQEVDFTAPRLRFTVHFPVKHLPGRSFEGSYSDFGDGATGVARIQYLLRDLATYQYIDLAGNLAPWEPVDVDFTFVDSFAVFEIAQSVPDGRYRLYTRAFDHAGNISDWRFNHDYIVGYYDDYAPRLNTYFSETIDIGDVLRGSATEFGTPSTGISSVEYMIRRRTDFGYVDTFGNDVVYSPTEANFTFTTSTADVAEWSIDNYLPVGPYRLYVRASDSFGNTSAWFHKDFNVQDLPDVTDLNVRWQYTPGNTRSFLAVYNRIDTVPELYGQVVIRRLSDFSYVDLEGNVSGWNPLQILPAPSEDLNPPAFFFSLESLPPGDYRVYSRVHDTYGNKSEWIYEDNRSTGYGVVPLSYFD